MNSYGTFANQNKLNQPALQNHNLIWLQKIDTTIKKSSLTWNTNLETQTNLGNVATAPRRRPTQPTWNTDDEETLTKWKAQELEIEIS